MNSNLKNASPGKTTINLKSLQRSRWCSYFSVRKTKHWHVLKPLNHCAMKEKSNNTLRHRLRKRCSRQRKEGETLEFHFQYTGLYGALLAKQSNFLFHLSSLFSLFFWRSINLKTFPSVVIWWSYPTKVRTGPCICHHTLNESCQSN